MILLQGGASPPAVALKAIDNPDSDCSAIRRLKVQTAIRARQHRSRHLRAYFLCDDLNFALSVHCLHTSRKRPAPKVKRAAPVRAALFGPTLGYPARGPASWRRRSNSRQDNPIGTV